MHYQAASAAHWPTVKVCEANNLSLVTHESSNWIWECEIICAHARTTTAVAAAPAAPPPTRRLLATSWALRPHRPPFLSHSVSRQNCLESERGLHRICDSVMNWYTILQLCRLLLSTCQTNERFCPKKKENSLNDQSRQRGHQAYLGQIH